MSCFFAPNFAGIRQTNFVDFRRKFIKKHGAFPPEYMNYSRIGFEFLMVIGQSLKKYGVYFQQGLSTETGEPGWLTKGYKLSPQRDNAIVPFAYFYRGELMTVE